jgi:thiol:disulfide interchange protein DsbD
LNIQVRKMHARLSALLLAVLLVQPATPRDASAQGTSAPDQKGAVPAQKTKRPAAELFDAGQLLDPGAGNARPGGVETRIHFEVSVEPKTVRRGETARLTISGVPLPGFHTYPLTRRADNPEQMEAQLSRVTYADSPGLQPLWPVNEEPAPDFVKDSLGWFLEHKKAFLWTQDILVLPDARPGPQNLHLTISLQVCDEKGCLPGDLNFDVPLVVSDAAAVPLSSGLEARQRLAKPPIEVVSVPGSAPNPSATTAHQADPAPVVDVTSDPTSSNASPASDLLGFMWLGIWWGAVSLITPCVFPMIPITVSYFLKQSERQHHRPLTLALIYSLTIVVVLTLGGVLLMKILQPLSQHWAMNLVLGALFAIFALSLFGMFEIRLPSGLANLTSAKEGRGGIQGTVFMALTFTIISFTCVAPFYGTFIGLSASTQTASVWLRSALGALAYSATFACPFFFLALFPSLLRSLPKSGSWMNTVKVVMAFLELAAALKFLRAAELLTSGEAQFLTYDLVLGLYVALSLLCGLYLLGLFRLPHDDAPAGHLGVPRLLFSLAFLGLGFYLMPALFRYGGGEKQRPTGKVFAWLDSFLLPDTTDEPGPNLAADAGHRLVWTGDLHKGLAEAQGERRLVFLDFTGLT